MCFVWGLCPNQLMDFVLDLCGFICGCIYDRKASWLVKIMVYKADQSSSFKIAAYVITENACTARGKSPYNFDAKHKYSHSVHHFSS